MSPLLSTGQFFDSSEAPPPSFPPVEFISQTGYLTSQSSINSNFNIPDEDASRLVIVGVMVRNATNVNLSAVTIGGVPAKCIFSQSNVSGTSRWIFLFMAKVPTGTTINVAGTLSTTVTSTLLACWAAYGMDEVWTHFGAAFDTSGADPAITNAMVETGGFMLAFCCQLANTTPTAMLTDGSDSWTEDFEAISADEVVAGYTMDGTLTDSGVTITFDRTGTFSEFVYCSFGPSQGDWGRAQFLAGFNGTDGATAYNDEGPAGAALTFVGNAQLDTAQQKFGSASLLLDGTGDSVTRASVGNLLFSRLNQNHHFTAEGWFRWNADPAAFQALVCVWNATGNQRSWGIFRDQVGGQLEFLMSENGSTTLTDISVTWAPTLNQWYHIAADFDGTKYRLYVDGTMIGSSTTIRALLSSTAAMSIGQTAQPVSPFNGWVDEVRVTHGWARYGSDGGFTPPGEFARSL